MCERRAITKHSFWLLSIALLLSMTRSFASHGDEWPMGNEDCPCLSAEALADYDGHVAPSNVFNILGDKVDLSKYGIGCLPHDEDTTPCSDANDCTTIVPLPPDCDKSFCKRSWCWVDQNCSLGSAPSKVIPGRHYSYATCGELDRFTYTDRLRSLKGESFKVGFMANSGGWKGSYNPMGTFANNELWSGPTVEFIKETALMGGFTINITTPPEWLKPHSQEFFGNSIFDFCVYATSLGYLDFCVGGFTITGKRSSVTTMFETTTDPFYLVVFDEKGQTSLEAFMTATKTIFQPFTGASWATIFIIVLPILGLLTLYHEYGQPGSSFPQTETLLVFSRSSEDSAVVSRPIPQLKHVGSAFYTGILSFFSGSCDISVVTTGGKINLLAISSFVMIILAVYTANLAAILTQNAHKTKIESYDQAIKEGYNFCAERKVTDFLVDTYNADPSRFVPDPVSLGGDGKPGFNCPNCNARERVLEFMSRDAATNDQLYCKAAIMTVEDLQVMHSVGKHCDKTAVGESLGSATIGFPIFDKRAAPLSALFHQVKSSGVMMEKLHAAAPVDRCPVKNGQGSALTPYQLSGVWVVTFSCALLGLLVRCAKSLNHDNSGMSRHELRRYDQWLNPPGYDVIVNGYRYDAENNTIVKQYEADSSCNTGKSTCELTERWE